MRIRRAIGAAALAVLILAGCAAMQPTPSAPTDYVETWNDGFAEAQQDNCDQGFQPACDWAANNN